MVAVHRSQRSADIWSRGRGLVYCKIFKVSPFPTMHRRALALTVAWSISATSILAQPPTHELAGDIPASGELVTSLERVGTELELLRNEMGAPTPSPVNLRVRDAHPHELYFQAVTLFHKTDQLAFEHVRVRARPPSQRPAITLEDVTGVVKAAHDRLQLVSRNFGLAPASSAPPPAPEKTGAEIFSRLLKANHQIDLLVDRRISSSEVFQEVTAAVSYTARLLEHFPGARQIPDAPLLQRNKQPRDNYRRLLDCFALVHQISTGADLPILALVEPVEPVDVTVIDVFDLVTLLVSELSLLYARLPRLAPPVEAYFPGRQFPSHVYQRLGVLESQLTELARRATENPEWLEDSSAQ